jgi:hypothetical protein
MGDASKEGSSDSGAEDSVTEVAAEESFVRERALAIERGSVLAGRYQIEEIIGKGGSGVVLRAFDRTGQVVVALKVLKPELATDAKWEKRFSRELRLARPIQHPNVCRIFDIGEAAGHRFLTMELARGGSLRDELKRGRSAPRPFLERLADAQAAIAGLAAIHAAGIVHRDFKPDNLLRMADGRLVLSDFGLATDAANEPGVTVLIGTPHYMAPEVLAGEPATTRADVWALGVVLHEIFFDRRPERRPVSFDGSRKTPLRADSPTERALLVLCEMCLSDTPLERPDNAGAVAELFDRARSTRHLQRPRLPGYALGLAVAVVAAAIAGVALRRNHRRTRIVPGPSSRSAFVGLEPTGQAADWGKLATVVTEVPAHVHCFSMLDGKTALLVWGIPRRAEDVDLATGRRRPSQLAPETYAIGCPQPSFRRDKLLFPARNGAGTMEIRLSNRADGRDATTVTSGFEPLWLPSDDEFVYNVDSFHAAVFLMATSSSSLLSDPDPAARRPILEKAASFRGSEVALLFGSSRREELVAIYGGGELTLLKTFAVPRGHGIGFDGMSDHLFVSYRRSASASALTELDWREGTLRNLASYPGFDLISAFRNDGETVLLGRHRSNDAWLYGSDGRRRLTSDGENFSAAMSATGDLLLSKQGGDGGMSIWWQGRDGATREISPGPFDVTPQFGPDGRSWLYVDYMRQSIMLCSSDTGLCREFRHDEALPVWPRFSPDGKSIAYVTQMKVPKLVVVSLEDGTVKELGDAYCQCPPVWSSATRIWSLGGAARHTFWSERDLTTGARTGRQVEVGGDEINTGRASVDEVQCWPSHAQPGSAFFMPLRVETEESSRLLRVAPRDASR